MKSVFKVSAIMLLALGISSCSSGATKGNLEFSNTAINKITYDSETVSLSLEDSNRFFEILDSQNWYKATTTNTFEESISCQVKVSVKRTITNTNDLYDEGEHFFVYYGDLSNGEFFLDDAYFSSFSALTKTQINGDYTKTMRDIFSDYYIGTPS